MDLLETLKKTGDALIGSGKGETDILATLKKEHDEVGALLESLVESDSGAERKALLTQEVKDYQTAIDQNSALINSGKFSPDDQMALSRKNERLAAGQTSAQDSLSTATWLIESASGSGTTHPRRTCPRRSCR